MVGDAIFSPCGAYRYLLSRDWGEGKRVCGLLLNPSTASATKPDATVGTFTSFARRWGYAGFSFVNLFALCGTKPTALCGHPAPIGPDNDQHILAAIEEPTWTFGKGHSGLGWYHSVADYPEDGSDFYRCPKGIVGDRLWVRERTRRIGAVVRADDRPVTIDVQYEADGATRLGVPFPDRLKLVEHGKRLSMGCYREASRLTLEITDVRVQRLQEINEEDAAAEGVRAYVDSLPDQPRYTLRSHPFIAFSHLWRSINGPHSWDANPWVWAITFTRTEVANV